MEHAPVRWPVAGTIQRTVLKPPTPLPSRPRVLVVAAAAVLLVLALVVPFAGPATASTAGDADGGGPEPMELVASGARGDVTDVVSARRRGLPEPTSVAIGRPADDREHERIATAIEVTARDRPPDRGDDPPTTFVVGSSAGRRAPPPFSI